MLAWLESVLPHIQNAGLALLLLFVAYLLSLPLRRRYGHCDGTESKRSRKEFFAALGSYLAFSACVLIPSVPLVYWLNHTWDAEAWSPYHQAWLTFWGIHAVLRLVEGLFVETFVQVFLRFV